MMTNNEMAQVFDTVLSSPGMNEAVRIDMRISRKAVLLLHQIIQSGLSGKGQQEMLPLSGFLSSETQEELKGLGNDFLQKAGLVEMSEKLLHLSTLEKK
jgi:hypothetical protein